VTIAIFAPLAGWVLPLEEVPDEVFAGGMAGDGVAIDPTSDVVCAPVDGEVVPVGDARHAVTVRTAGGIEVLVHVGIDTVALKGRGFELLAKAGDRVAAGTPLLRFDLDRVARAARSLVTPVILAGAGSVRRRTVHRAVAVGELLFEVDEPVHGEGRAESSASPAAVHAKLRVPFDHGLHVRPAAIIAATLKPFAAEVEISIRGRIANARSSVGLMALGARCGDTVDARASGADAQAAMEALSAVLSPVATPAAAAARPKAAKTGRIEAVIASRGVCVGVATRLTQRDEPVVEQGAGASGEARARSCCRRTRSWCATPSSPAVRWSWYAPERAPATPGDRRRGRPRRCWPRWTMRA
jgi:phosphotransferase system HPr (HPr) family protein